MPDTKANGHARTVPDPPQAAQDDSPTYNAVQVAEIVANAVSTSRVLSLRNLFDSRRDIDVECGYPKDLTAEQYRYLYDREGIAERVVNVFPQETWAQDPGIFQTEDATTTAFEQAVQDLDDEHHLLHYLFRIDELSGIGTYGILLLGLDDGQELSEPVATINERGEQVGSTEHKLLYLRAIDESLVQITKFEKDPTNPRFGQPVLYNVTLNDPHTVESGVGASPDTTTTSVHWTRVIHVADNRKASEVFGVPRMRPVYNRLYDLRKLLGGSAEMFWKGAFPGLAFEANSNLQAGDVTVDSDSLKAEIANYHNGLQRALTSVGGKWTSLAPNISDPSAHVDTQLRAIAITLGVPMRIFMGSEQAQLASGQDSRRWNGRIGRRRETYVTPMIIRPTVDRLMMLGVLPAVDEYGVSWPDLDTPSDMDKAELAKSLTEALAKYVGGGVDTLIPPLEYLLHVLHMPMEEAEAILDAAIAHINAASPEADDVDVPGRNPTPPGLDGQEGGGGDGTPTTPPPDEDEE